jgi:hypothetical protein
MAVKAAFLARAAHSNAVTCILLDFIHNAKACDTACAVAHQRPSHIRLLHRSKISPTDIPLVTETCSTYSADLQLSGYL